MSASNEEDDGPKFVWTFPIVRILSRRRLITSIASRMAEGEITGALQNDSKEEDSSEVESNERIEEIESDIDDISNQSDLVFEQAEVNEITIEEDVFIPTRTQIDPGETVVWENEDDSSHRVVAIDGSNFSSEVIGPGETFQNTFDEEGVIVYVDTMVGGDIMCGVILVGDVELDRELPCEQETERVLFSENETEGTNISDSGIATMSEKADEKQELKEDAV